MELCIKFIFIIQFFLLIKYSIFYQKTIKICLCAVGKEENNYINEFIEYYYKYKIDKIFFYDNNELDKERYEIKISKFISINFVEILNIRGKTIPQKKIYQDCYQKNNKIYNWIMFLDLDEFIFLKNYTNIRDYLKQKKFQKCQSIYLNWLVYIDNNLKFYDNRTLIKRFYSILEKSKCWGKSIIRGNIANIKITSVHILDNRIKSCDGIGNIIELKSRYCNKPDFKNYFIKHFKYKSTEEYVNKLNKGNCVYRNKNPLKIKYMKALQYLKENPFSLDKISFISKNAGLDKNILIKKLNNYN